MIRNKILLSIALIEILIGVITIVATVISLFLSANAKTPNVFVFVILTAAASSLIGIGILQLRTLAYKLLIYFSSVIVLTKVLIFTDIIQLNGALEISIPSPIKDGISVLYHIFVIYFLTRKDIRAFFIK